jgi:hypothetical protein
MDSEPPTTARSTIDSQERLGQDWDSCMHVARLLNRPPDATHAVAEILFNVYRGIASFDSLPLDSAEPAVRFYAGWD